MKTRDGAIKSEKANDREPDRNTKPARNIKLDIAASPDEPQADYVIRRFNASLAGLISPWGWIFAETPLSAISRSNWSPESAEVRPLFNAGSLRMSVRFHAGAGLRLMQFKQSSLNKN